MIYIDISRLNIPEGWKTEASRINDELMNVSDEARSEFIEHNSRLWRDLKSELERISNRKCWYCETRYDRADFHVDHHRPKNRVRNEDGSEEPGYWWLAFDYKNLRLACSYCNCPHIGPDGITRGKSDLFPLFPGSTRASTPESNLDDEIPILLDPINPIDPFLLWFLQDGKAYPKHSENDHMPCLKANKTIDILNLNDPRITEARRELWLRCAKLIGQGDEAYIQFKRGSPAGIRRFRDVIEEMRELVKSSAQYSATARACFQGSPYRWVRETVS